MKTSPCKGCKDRHKACHDSCDRYKEWKAEHDAAMQYVREQNATVVCDYVLKARDRERMRRR